MIFTKEFIEAFVEENYHLKVEATSLNGYDEQNFLLESINGEKFILKIATEEHGIEFLDAQVKMLRHLAEKGFGRSFPQVLPDKNETAICVYEKDGKKYYIRLLTFLEGDFWVNQDSFSEEMYENLGWVLGNMDKALIDFSHAALHKNYLWDVSRAAEAGKKLQFIKDPACRRLADYFLLQFETEVVPATFPFRISTLKSFASL